MSERVLRAVLAVLALGGALALAWAGLAADGGPLAAAIDARLPETGVENPVTAVLLNFRGLDTLLEVTVLLLAFICVLTLVPEEPTPAVSTPVTHGRPVSPLLAWYVPRLVPLVALLGLALWWKGSTYPGGAFQAGTVLAGGGVLLLLSGQLRVPAANPGLRLALVVGPLFFLGLSLVLALVAGYFMQYPQAHAKAIVQWAEVAFTLTIAFSLFMLVVGIPPHRRGYFPGGEP